MDFRDAEKYNKNYKYEYILRAVLHENIQKLRFLNLKI